MDINNVGDTFLHTERIFEDTTLIFSSVLFQLHDVCVKSKLAGLVGHSIRQKIAHKHGSTNCINGSLLEAYETHRSHFNFTSGDTKHWSIGE